MYIQYFNNHDNSINNTWRDVDSDKINNIWKDVDNDKINNIWKDVNDDEEYLIFEHKPFLYSLKGTIAKKVSFEKNVYVTLIPETHEYHHIKELLWYSQEELDQFIQNEIENRRKEFILQCKELQQMRQEEIYSIITGEH